MKKTKREESAQDTKQKKIKPKKPSLSKALDIEENLRLCKKFELSDRVIFSQNLGNLVAIEIKKNPSLTVHKLFKQSFGSSAESLYKKRKSLIILPKETMPQGPSRSSLRSKARDYLAILEALSKIKKDYSQESELVLKKKLILRLVENSSFDDQRKIKDRVYDEQLAHLKDILTKIVDRVTDEVDLDYQLVWYENYDPRRGLFCKNRNKNLSAPVVEIADIMIESHTIGGSAKITFTKEEIHIAQGEDKDGIERLIRAKLLKDYSDQSYDDSDEFTWCVHNDDTFQHTCEEEYKPINQRFPKLKYDNYTPACYMRSSIFLEIRYDEWSDRWQPVITWKTADPNYSVRFSRYDVYDRYIRDWDPDASQLFVKAMDIFSDDDCNYLRASFDPDDDKDSDVTTFNLFWDNAGGAGSSCLSYGDKFRQQTVMDENCLDENDQLETYEFLLNSREYGEELKYEIVPMLVTPGSFTIAPSESFASIILRNLAYASEEDRIDNLLLKDAKQKNKIFKELEKDQKNKYLSAIARFENDQLKG
jgi:hypothetical protein